MSRGAGDSRSLSSSQGDCLGKTEYMGEEVGGSDWACR